MYLYSTILRPLFWIIMGLLYALLIGSAGIWAEDLGLSMTWWKWVLTAGWYIFLSFSVAGGFTLMGEKEPRAGYKFLGFFLAVTIVLGVGLYFLLRAV